MFDGNYGMSRLRVFVSYRREPEENTHFVRNLVSQLRLAGLAPWLDKEQISGGDYLDPAVSKAVQNSDCALIVVTSNWVESKNTQFELSLIDERKLRLVVLRRDKLGLNALGAKLTGKVVLDWPRDDDEPDARLWEVYCGLTGAALGPESEWNDRGRYIVQESIAQGQISDEQSRPIIAPKRSTTVSPDSPLPCNGKPKRCFVGRKRSYLITDQNEWLVANMEDQISLAGNPLAPYSSAVIGENDELYVGMFEPIAAIFRNEEWDHVPLEASALALAAVAGDVVAGTAAGGLMSVLEMNSRARIRLRDPIVGLAVCQDIVLALGSQGMFGWIAWPPDSSTSLRWIETEASGRPLGFFPAVEEDRVGFFSKSRLSLVKPTSQWVETSEDIFEDGVQDVQFLGAGTAAYLAVSELGSFCLLDPNLTQIRTVRLKEQAGSVVGYCGTGRPGEFLAWTESGGLFLADAEGRHDRLSDNGVIFAFASLSHKNEANVVRRLNDASVLQRAKF